MGVSWCSMALIQFAIHCIQASAHSNDQHHPIFPDFREKPGGVFVDVEAYWGTIPLIMGSG